MISAVKAAVLTLGATVPNAPDRLPAAPSVVELRQYKIVPGRRDAFIALFDRAFVESQEAEGMRLIGQFRDLDDPDRFVWLRGFADMAARRRALEHFYSGPVWQAHRGEANPMLEDNDNVLLLRPAWPGAGFTLAPRPAANSDEGADGFVVATILYLWKPPEEGFTEFFRTQVRPALESAGIPVLAVLEPERAPNDFPRLPVRSDERLLVWFTRFESETARDELIVRLGASADWRERIAPALQRHMERPPQTLRLAPTARSALR
ncbi:NIPSNAP family protein [Sphingosinicella sp. CPCC 101087]|uniref:NIPSNAP family protein n=1 Tax=Sphingosinicella sp. CPCC 101087 TaxID=2497754 RepID=UPI00101BD7C7|nr:NIPSNAP family protein [Sphingosinicella sp. CPCC 101087]